MFKYDNVVCVTIEELEQMIKHLPECDQEEIMKNAIKLSDKYAGYYAKLEYQRDRDKWEYVDGKYIEADNDN